MGKTTQLYHSELAGLCNGQWLSVRIDSDVLRSKFNKPGENKQYCNLTINGAARSYFVENEACGNALRGRKNQTIFIMASGSRDDAQIQVDPNAPPASATPPPQNNPPPPAQHHQPPPQTHQQPPPGNATTQQPQKKSEPLPVFGQTVGMAIKESCEFLRAEKKPFDARFVYEISSDIIRISRALEAGKLAPKPNEHGVREYPEKTKQEPATPPPPPPPPPPPAASEPPPEDEVPF